MRNALRKFSLLCLLSFGLFTRGLDVTRLPEAETIEPSPSSIPVTSGQLPKPLRILSNAAHEALEGGKNGAIAGVMQVVSLMWLRTIMNYQLRYGSTTTEAARELWRQGGMARFYHGVTFAVLQGPLARYGLNFGFDEKKKKKVIPFFDRFGGSAVNEVTENGIRFLLLRLLTKSEIATGHALIDL